MESCQSFYSEANIMQKKNANFFFWGVGDNIEIDSFKLLLYLHEFGNQQQGWEGFLTELCS